MEWRADPEVNGQMCGAIELRIAADEPGPRVIAVGDNQMHLFEEKPGERRVAAPRFDAVEEQHDAWHRPVE